MRVHVTRLACAALAAGLAASPAEGQAPTSIRTKHFEVVARDKPTATAKGKELEQAAKLFRKLFGVAPPFGRVTFLRPGRPGTGVSGQWTPPTAAPGDAQPRWTLPWYDPPRSERLTDPDLMTHEAAHLMFIDFVAPKLTDAAKARKDRYASNLPDWWDEGIAVFLEREYMKSRRRAHMKQHLRKMIPLARLFTEEHPMAEELNRPGGARREDDMQKEQLLVVYYAQTMAVVEFLLRAGGPKLIQRVNDQLAQGKSMEAVLAELPGRSLRSLRSVSGFQRSFVSFVRKSYR